MTSLSNITRTIVEEEGRFVEHSPISLGIFKCKGFNWWNLVRVLPLRVFNLEKEIVRLWINMVDKISRLSNLILSYFYSSGCVLTSSNWKLIDCWQKQDIECGNIFSFIHTCCQQWSSLDIFIFFSDLITELSLTHIQKKKLERVEAWI